MAETKILEREYVIPLRKAILRVPRYRRTGRAIKAIKEFVAKHMKIENRDVSNVRINVDFNNEVWFRGRASPPFKVKVKAVKEGDVVRVDFVEIPEHVKFARARHERMHKKADKKEEKVEAKQEVKEEKSPEAKQEEKEKEQAVAEMGMKEAEKASKAQKHITKIKAPKINRMALKK